MIIASLDVETMVLIRWVPNRLASDLSFEIEPISKHDAAVSTKLPVDSWRPFRNGLAALVGLKVCVLTLIGYQWQIVAGEFFHDNEARLIAYFAAFFAISDLLIIVVQLFASGKLLDRFGIGVPLKAFPLALAAVGVLSMSASVTGLGVASALIVTFTAARGLNVLQRSLHDPGLAAAYSVIDPSVRSQAIVFVKGMIKPFAEAVVSIALLFYADVIAFDWITSCWMILLVPWYIAATWVSAFFRRSSSADLKDALE